MQQVYHLWIIEITSRCGVCNTIYYNDSYLMLFVMKNEKVLKLDVNIFSNFLESTSLFQPPQIKAS